MGLGLVLGAISGGAGGAAASLQQSEQFRQQQELEVQRNNMRLEAEKAAAQFKYDLENAPKKRLGQFLQEAKATPVAMEAEPVSELTPEGAKAAGLTMGGISGDIGELRKKYTDMLSSPDITPEQVDNVKMVLDQLDKQADGQALVNKSGVEGKTKLPDTISAIRLAIDKAAASGDIQAVEEGKKALNDLVVHMASSAAMYNTLTGKPDYVNQQGLEIQKLKSQTAQSIADKKLEAQERMVNAKIESLAKKGSADPAQVESIANMVANYQMPAPSARVMATDFGKQVMARVQQLKPDYSASDYAAMDKAVKSFSTGKQGDTVRSLNVAVDHIGTAMGLIDALNNGQINTANKLKNAVASWAGDVDVTNFEAVKGIVADEITKSVVGGAGAWADREEMAKQIRSSNSAEQIRGVLDKFEHLMAGQLNGLRQQYESNTERDDFAKFLLPKTIEVFSNMDLSKPLVPYNAKSKSIPNPVQPTANGNRKSLSEIFG